MMTTQTTHDHEVLVLRLPEEEGNFTYRLAELPSDKAREWKQRLASGAKLLPAREIGMAFGSPMTLFEVMERLQSRDFQVLDYPTRH